MVDVDHDRQGERHRVCVDVVQDVPCLLSDFPPPCAVIDRGEENVNWGAENRPRVERGEGDNDLRFTSGRFPST